MCYVKADEQAAAVTKIWADYNSIQSHLEDEIFEKNSPSIMKLGESIVNYQKSNVALRDQLKTAMHSVTWGANFSMMYQFKALTIT